MQVEQLRLDGGVDVIMGDPEEKVFAEVPITRINTAWVTVWCKRKQLSQTSTKDLLLEWEQDKTMPRLHWSIDYGSTDIDLSEARVLDVSQIDEHEPIVEIPE